MEYRARGTYLFTWSEVPRMCRATYGRLAELVPHATWTRQHPRDEMYWGPQRRGRPQFGTCPAAVSYHGLDAYYPCGNKGHAAYDGHCWTHRGGKRDPMPTRKRTTTTIEEVSEADPPRVEIRVSLGKLTVATVLAAARKIEKAAGQANAPEEAEVWLDSYAGGGGEVEARIRWEMPS